MGVCVCDVCACARISMLIDTTRNSYVVNEMCSGLGTSSILAGAVMAVLWRASGKAFDIDSLNHAVRIRCYLAVCLMFALRKLFWINVYLWSFIRLVTDASFTLRTVYHNVYQGWLGSGVVSMLDSGAEGPGFKSQS